MTKRVLTCEDHRICWVHEDDRFDDRSWDPTAVRTAYLRVRCPAGDHHVASPVGYQLVDAVTVSKRSAPEERCRCGHDETVHSNRCGMCSADDCPCMAMVSAYQG